QVADGRVHAVSADRIVRNEPQAGGSRAVHVGIPRETDGATRLDKGLGYRGELLDRGTAHGYRTARTVLVGVAEVGVGLESLEVREAVTVGPPVIPRSGPRVEVVTVPANEDSPVDGARPAHHLAPTHGVLARLREVARVRPAVSAARDAGRGDR